MQRGTGRTGPLLAYIYYGVTPGILTSARVLGDDFPVSTMLTTHEIASTFHAGSHDSAYGGDPLVCAVVDAAFDLTNTPAVLDGMSAERELFVKHPQQLDAELDLSNNIRGMDLLTDAGLRP